MFWVPQITEHDFGLVAGHLVETLREADVEEADIEAIVEIVGSVKDQVVNEPKAA